MGAPPQTIRNATAGRDLIQLALVLPDSNAAGLERPYKREELLSILSPITHEFLIEAQEDALGRLASIRHAQGDDYEKLCNEEALIGNLPQWHHLYLQEFGAFSRPEPECRILSDVDLNIKKLIHTTSGLFLHVVSGDSGCGKSTLIKQIIRRLVERESLPELDGLKRVVAALQIFEVTDINDFERLKEAVTTLLLTETDNPLYLIYFDDLFALEDNEIAKIFSILMERSRSARIYCLVTSPSWLFDLATLRRFKTNFQLANFANTTIPGLELQDRLSLEQQYLAIHGSNGRPDLINLILHSDVDIILLKLALHHNLDYSEYLNQLFNRLEKRPKWLAALLLFSSLSRFYVHFPVTLLKLLNDEILDSGSQLWENADDYERCNDQGFKLFRVRRGKRNTLDTRGIPDTVAPFHDRVAQVIYTTWGQNRKTVPIFNCKLGELTNHVYDMLNSHPETRPLMANIFRGSLAVAPDSELTQFVEYYGPARNNRWTLVGQAEAAYRWIIYSKFNLGRTKELRIKWEAALERTIEESSDSGVLLIALLLNPLKSDYYGTKVLQLGSLDASYFPLIKGVLDQLITQKPLPIGPLSIFLSQVNLWLDNRGSTASGFLSYRDSFIFSLTGINSQYTSNLRRFKSLGQALADNIKAYLLAIRNVYKSNEILGKRGLLSLLRNVQWSPEESKQILTAILKYIQDEKSIYRPVLFEHLLFFLHISDASEVSGNDLLDLYFDICMKNANFPGLTYTSAALWNHLRSYRRRYRTEYLKILERIVKKLSSGQLERFTRNVAYPDFATRLLQDLRYNHYLVTGQEVLSLLKPLLAHFGTSPQAPYIVNSANRLNIADTDSFFSEDMTDSASRQVRLWLATRLNAPPALVLDEFIQLLRGRQLDAPLFLAVSLTEYFRRQIKATVEPSLLEACEQHLYDWLRDDSHADDAALLFTVVTTDFLFSESKLDRLEALVARNIQNIPHLIPSKYFPLKYLKWWLARGIEKLPPKQKYDLLNAFWRYILQNSHLKAHAKFVIYEEYFLLLLASYGVEQDETWWGDAAKTLVQYYSKSIEGRRKSRRSEPIRYQQRRCLEQILKTLLDRLSLLSTHMRGDFAGALNEAFAHHDRHPWMAPWIGRLNPELQRDPTSALIEYLNSIRGQPTNIFDIRNRLAWWYRGVVPSKQELPTELGKIWGWLDKQPIPSVAIFVLPALLELIKEHPSCLNVGPLIVRFLTEDDAESGALFFLIRRYLEYLSAHNISACEQWSQEIISLQNVVRLCLAKAPEWASVPSTAYGMQELFEACRKYNIAFDPAIAERAYFSVSEALADYEEGGAISRYYFPLLFHNPNQHPELSKYLDWIEGHLDKRQAPYILMHLFEALPASLTFDEILACWRVLKRMMKERIKSEATRCAAKLFLDCAADRYPSLPDGETLLNQVTKEYYELCQFHRNDDRVVYLLASYNTFWRRLIKTPSNEEMVTLWESILVRQGSAKDDITEAFDNLTRKLNKHLGEVDDLTLLSGFSGTLIAFIEKNPDHFLSPKFASLVILNRIHFPRLVAVFPTLYKHQEGLEHLAYATGRYLKDAAGLIGSTSRIECENAILKELTLSLHKPFSELCLATLLHSVTPVIHYQTVVHIFQTYLKMRLKPKIQLENDYLDMFRAFRKYEDSISNEAAMEHMENYLAILQQNALQERSAMYFSGLLRFWDASRIPQQPAADALRQLIIEASPTRWRRFLQACERFSKLFDDQTPISPDLSVEQIIHQLREHETQGLLSVKRRIQNAHHETLPVSPLSVG